MLNFGGDPASAPLEFVHGGFIALGDVPEDAQVPNSNCGWRLNPYDATPAVDVQADGMAVQAHWGAGWQGCRANRVSVRVVNVSILELFIGISHCLLVQ